MQNAPLFQVDDNDALTYIQKELNNVENTTSADTMMDANHNKMKNGSSKNQRDNYLLIKQQLLMTP